jgi:hypothetical protein
MTVSRRVVASIAIALLAAACSASPSTAAGHGTNAQAIAYSHCVRSHGVPNFPDPTSKGQVPKVNPQELGVSTTQFQSAETACQHLYPTGGGVLNRDSIGECEQTGNCPQALVQQAMAAMLRLAMCIRSHGLPGWPDPTLDSEHRPGFNLLHVDFSPNSTQVNNALRECQHTMPRGVPVPIIAPGS